MNPSSYSSSRTRFASPCKLAATAAAGGRKPAAESCCSTVWMLLTTGLPLAAPLPGPLAGHSEYTRAGGEQRTGGLGQPEQPPLTAQTPRAILHRRLGTPGRET